MSKILFAAGYPREKREWYDTVAGKMCAIAGAVRDKAIVHITKHGRIVLLDGETKIENPKLHILTINHKTSPDFLADSMEEAAKSLGFDTGVRRGRVEGSR